MDLEALKSDIAQKAEQAASHAIDFARERPHAAVAMALGLGWVLGNGLPPRLIMGAARLGIKAALGGLLASGGLASILGGSDEPPSPQPPLDRTPRASAASSEATSRPRTGASK